MERYNQREMIDNIKRKAHREIDAYFPVERGDYRFSVENVEIEEPDMSYQSQQNSFYNDGSLEMKVYADVHIYYKGSISKGDGVPETFETDGEYKKIKTHKRNMITLLPIPTDRGTFIRGGNETVILNQMRMRNGIYVHPKKMISKENIIPVEVRAGRRRFKINFEADRGRFMMKDLTIDRNKTGSSNVNYIAFLRFLGVTDQEISQAIGDDELANEVLSQADGITPEKIYSQISTNEFPGLEEARKEVIDYLEKQTTFDDKAKRVNQATIGSSSNHFDTSSMLQVISKVIQEEKTPGSNESPDDFRFKEIKGPDDIIADTLRKGLANFSKNKLNKVSRMPVNKDTFKKIEARPIDTIYKPIGSMYNDSTSEQVDKGNPLDAHQKLYKITSLGGGGLDAQTASNPNRNLQDSAFSKIDPIETSQSQRMGLVQHLASGAKIKDNQVYSKFYRVKNGKIDKSRVIDDLDPVDEYEEYIAFFNPEKMIKDRNGKYTRFREGNVKVRHKGDFINVSSNKVTLVDQSPSSHMSHSGNLIPYSAHNDGARMLMGAGMQKQSLNLEDPDVPLVQSIVDPETGRTAEEEMATNGSYDLRSPVSGTVKSIHDHTIDIETEDGKTEKVDKLHYFTSGKTGSFINHKPKVKAGDKVKSGDLLADGWQAKDGKMALGKNVQVAYMPFDGYNFEDGVVASESFSKKMVSEEVKPIIVELEQGMTKSYYGSDETVKLLKQLNVSQGDLAKLDNRGIIKKGQKVRKGDILVAHVKERESRELSDGEKDVRKMTHGKILDLPEDRYRDASYRLKGYQSGEVIDVYESTSAGGGLKVTVKLRSYAPMEVGDKLAGRHGNKGTITKILPDNEMPHTEDGKHTELIFSPLAVPSRKNMGQLYEINAGLVAEKKGLSEYKVENFNKSEVDRLKKELKEIGHEDGKQTLINPKNGKPYENKVTTGPQYIMKLEHKVEKKITSRNINGALDEINQMPRKTSGAVDGDRHNPQSVGGMEFWSLTSAGASENIHEMTTLKSDGAGDRERRRDIFSAIRNGTPIPDPVTPGTLKTLGERFNAAGLKMQPLKDHKEVSIDDKFNSLMLEPMNDREIEALAPTALSTDKSIDSRTKKFFPGGIYDEEIFGKNGDQWGRIELEEAVPHPVLFDNKDSANPFAAMLASKGLKKSQLSKIMDGDLFVVKDSGDTHYQVDDVVSNEQIIKEEKKGNDMNVMSGGPAIAKLLDSVNLKEEYDKAEARLQEATKIEDRSRESSILKILGKALDKGMSPNDFMMKNVPVLPTKHRRPLTLNDGQDVSEDDISKLYKSILTQNKKVKEWKNKGFNEDEMDSESLNQLKADNYNAVRQTLGVGKSRETEDGEPMKGVLESLSTKQGFLRGRMQSKMQDYSGRSVITVDPSLTTDEVMLPEDMAAEIFEPQIKKRLRDKNYSIADIDDIMGKRDERFRESMDEVAKDHPVLLNRQPSLHKHSFQAFMPKIRYNGDDGSETQRAIGLNPVVTTGYNADFDGDQMAVHVPLGEGAIKEAKDKMLPSKNILNPTNNGLIMDLKHEMQLGIFYMTRDRMPEGEMKEFDGFDDLHEAYQNGDVTTYQRARVSVPMEGPVIATVGQHLFNLSLPQGLQNYEKYVDMNKKKTQAMLMDIVNDNRFGGVQRAVATINRLQNVGFESATMSGMSISISDFDDVGAKTKEEIGKASAKQLKKLKPESSISGFIDGRDYLDRQTTSDAKKGIHSWIEKNVDKDSSLGAIVSSGARGNAGQLNAMAGIIGEGKDVEGNPTRPIVSSHLEGLTPDEFWDLSYDSRKGILDKSIESQEPGALTRRIWMNNKQTTISEKDCKDRRGVTIDFDTGDEKTNNRNKKKIHGRVLLKSVRLKDGSTVQTTGKPLTRQEEDRILAQGTGEVNFRSPLTCKSTSGVCQKCYGAAAGSTDTEFVPLGDAVGSVAAQALGEPSQQAIMRAFHVGAAQSKASGAFDQIKQTLDSPKGFTNPDLQGVMAEKSGIIRKIESKPFAGTTVYIEGQKKGYKLGKKELAPGLAEGVRVEKGEMLTREFDDEGNMLVQRNPHDVIRIQGVDAAQTLLTNNLEDAYAASDTDDTDSRHYEVVTRNMTDSALVTDPGTSPFQHGQRVRKGIVDQFNRQSGKVHSVSMDYSDRQNVIGSIAAQDYREGSTPFSPVIVQEGETITAEIWEKLKKKKNIRVKSKPIKYDTQIRGVKETDTSDGNWLNAAAYQDSRRMIGEGAAFGMRDKLDNPLTRQMTGLKGNFASGFTDFIYEQQKDKNKEKGFLKGFFW